MLDLSTFTIEQVTLLVIGILVLLSLLTGGISFLLETDRSRQWWGDWFQGVSTEMVGAAVTTIFFTFIVGAVEQQQARLQLQTDLIDRLGSSANSEAIRAAEELVEMGWLIDGTLQDAMLPGANLQNALLINADMQSALLFDANLANASLPGANLANAILQAANLTNADLSDAILTNADLNTANLNGANLVNAQLAGATLLDANLAAVNLTEAQFDPQTTLPDGTNWSPETDVERFTDRDHPNFWRPSGDVLPWWVDTN